MKATDTVHVIVRDRHGQLMDSHGYFETMQAARAFFKDVKDDRGYWAAHFESDDEASKIYTIQLTKNGELILEHFPEFT